MPSSRDAEWAWVLEFLTYGGDALRAYPEYARIALVDDRYVVTNDEIARRHRMSIGTIVGDAQIGVAYLRGDVARLGRGIVRRATQARRSIRVRRHAARVRARPRHEGVGASRA